MNLLFELSGEHSSLPMAEIIGCIEGEGWKFKILDDEKRILIVDIDIESSEVSVLSERIALSHYISQFYVSSRNLEDIKSCAKTIEIEKTKTFRIRCRSLGFKKDLRLIEREIGSIFENKVDLNRPDVEIRILLTDKLCWYLGVKIAAIHRSKFEKRKVLYRPFFLPISIHPRLARALVNLSRVKESDTVLDPFCGTGGILVEAGLIGCNIVGSDINKNILLGAEKNLDALGLKYKLLCADISDILKNVDSVDAVVTDPPYGRSASTHGETLQLLYTRMFTSVQKILKPKKYFVVIFPDEKFVRLGKNYMEITELHTQKVHKSLTRYICVFKQQ